MSEAAASITVRVPLAVRRRRGRKTIVLPEGAATPAPARSRADPALVKALARAHRWRRMLDEGRYASISEMAAAECIERGYLGSLLRLTLLAPNIVEAILDGRQPDGVALARLMAPIPWAWNEQTTTLDGLDVSRTDVRGIRAGNSAPGDRPCPDARGGPALAIGGLRPLVQRATGKGDGTPGAVTGHVRLWHRDHRGVRGRDRDAPAARG